MIDRIFYTASEAADFVTAHFASLGYGEMVLEFEKCFLPYLQVAKKRYAGLKYEPDGKGAMALKGIDCKGIETEKKDALPFVKEIMHGCLDLLMHRQDEHAALRLFEAKAADLVADRIPFDLFVFRKNFHSRVEGKTDTIAHARVNALRKARAPGTEAAPNEQVSYVIVNGHKDEKTTQLAEDADYAREQGLRLNHLWYFEHAIREPVGRLLGVFDTIDFASSCAKISAALNAKRLGMGRLDDSLFEAEGEADAATAPRKSHVPLPPAPRKKKKKRA